ncbi:hypothetical protein GIS00_15845 [Nakamurella sp. YIM 132087]|uniref:Lipocalin-like domain-containing protein n=1 Tax=Nakamurella alba TaxID=2665158 RepID=A0A7K1FMU8_9ACTN|nr:hypothetical protein [Nakamurella alba]MTD15410.1 hypothetical protein [Nakamurella alba]
MTHPAELVGSWVHAHEEDHDGLQVYRPAGTPLPPSRGRSSFTLLADGGAALGSPGPDDRGATADGTWSLTGSVLAVRTPGVELDLDVVTTAPDRLDVRRSR